MLSGPEIIKGGHVSQVVGMSGGGYYNSVKVLRIGVRSIGQPNGTCRCEIKL